MDVFPMYMPGRTRTASRPSRTVMDELSYAFSTLLLFEFLVLLTGFWGDVGYGCGLPEGRRWFSASFVTVLAASALAIATGSGAVCPQRAGVGAFGADTVR